MRGQKLFIRPVDAEDRDAVAQFLGAESEGSILPRSSGNPSENFGLLAKLLGELVAVVEMGMTADAVQIVNIVVARRLRRKRIGRAMLDEVERMAAKMDRHRLIVDGLADAQEFFQRTGFQREGARWIRNVQSSNAERATR